MQPLLSGYPRILPSWNRLDELPPRVCWSRISGMARASLMIGKMYDPRRVCPGARGVHSPSPVVASIDQSALAVLIVAPAAATISASKPSSWPVRGEPGTHGIRRRAQGAHGDGKLGNRGGRDDIALRGSVVLPPRRAAGTLGGRRPVGAGEVTPAVHRPSRAAVPPAPGPHHRLRRRGR